MASTALESFVCAENIWKSAISLRKLNSYTWERKKKMSKVNMIIWRWKQCCEGHWLMLWFMFHTDLKRQIWSAWSIPILLLKLSHLIWRKLTPCFSVTTGGFLFTLLVLIFLNINVRFMLSLFVLCFCIVLTKDLTLQSLSFSFSVQCFMSVKFLLYSCLHYTLLHCSCLR